MEHLGRKAAALLAPLALVVALVIPSMASAAVENPGFWAEGGVRLANGVKKAITFSGNLKLNGELGSVECPVTGTDTIENVKTAGKAGETPAHDSIKPFTISTPCVTGGLLAACTVEKAEAVGLPWATFGYFDASGKRRLEIQGVHFKNTFKSGCLVSSIEAGPGTLDAFLLPATSGGITGVEFTAASGSLPTTPNIGSVTISGSVTVSPSAKYELVAGF